MSMSSTSFRFKQFTIDHDRTSMKVGTDGVLLGAWADISGASTILDIGTGTGVIAIMLAQRSQSNVMVDAVELDEFAFEQAMQNVKRSPWPEKVKVYHTAIQNFHSNKKYDLIISNPPYFQNSQKPPDPKRSITRHTDTLSFLELITAATRLLSTQGKFNVILPFQEGLRFIDVASKHNLYCTRQWSFRSRKEKPIERWLLEFCDTFQQKNENEIVLYEKGEDWSDEYRRLTGDFYL
jgi:tRNA1Val (adenine37-N6)-methyltransferase